MQNKSNKNKSTSNDVIKIDRELLIEPFDSNYIPPLLKAYEFLELLDKAGESFSYVKSEMQKDIDFDALILDDDGFIVGNKNLTEYQSKMKPLKDCEDFLKKYPFDVYDLIQVMHIYSEKNVSSRAKSAALSKLKECPKQKALAEIKQHYQAKKAQFKRRGFSAQFIREMWAQYPDIESQKTIEKIVSALNKENELIPR